MSPLLVHDAPEGTQKFPFGDASVTLASPTNGRKTSSGNQAAQWPAPTPAMPTSAARKPSGTAPTSPMNRRAGGALATSSGSTAAASARDTIGDAPPIAAPAPSAVKPQAAIVAARPSLPSMKL